MRRALLLAAVLLAAPAPAHAAWSAPKRVFSDNELAPTALLLGGARGLLAFERPGDGFAAASLSTTGAPRRATLSKQVRQATRGRRGRFLFLHVRYPKDANDDGLDCPCAKTRIGWSEATAGFGPHHALTTTTADDVRIAGDAAGNAIIAWTNDKKVYAALRAAGSASFSRPKLIATLRFVSGIAVAIERGRFAVLVATAVPAASSRNEVEMLSGTARAGVRRRQHIPLSVDFLAMSVAMASDGSVAAAWWGDSEGTGDAVRKPVYVATTSQTGELVATEVGSDADADAEVEAPAVVAGPRGEATAMWIQLAKAHVVSAPADGTLSEPVALGAASGSGALARRDDGAVLAAWPDQGIDAAIAREPGRWGAVQRVHRGDDSRVVASFTRRPLLAWVRYRFKNPGGPDTLLISRGSG